MTTLQEAKLVRDKVVGLLHDATNVSGVGIERIANGYGVRVNLKNRDRGDLPPNIDGVPISTRVTGRVSVRPGGRLRAS